MRKKLFENMFQKRSPLQYIYWLLFIIGIVVLLYFLILLYPYLVLIFKTIGRLFLPFFIAAIIAYVLVPTIKFLNDRGIPKSIAILSIYLIFLLTSSFIIYKIYPLFVDQLEQLLEQLPEIAQVYQDLVNQLYEKTSYLPEVVHEQMDKFLNSFENRLEDELNNWSIDLIYIVDIFILLLVIPVLVFYFLRDHEQIFSFIKLCFPHKHHRKLSLIFEAIDESLGNYIRAQVFVCLFVGISSSFVFYLFQLPYAAILGFIMAITNVIPYFGPIIGLIPVAMISLSMTNVHILYVVLAVFLIQIIENNLISPFIVGKTTKLHPVAILLVLLIGGEFFGIFGMIVAVPTLTIVKTSIEKIRLLRSVY